MAGTAARAGAPHQVVTALSLAQGRPAVAPPGRWPSSAPRWACSGCWPPRCSPPAPTASSTPRRLYGWGWDANIAGAEVTDLDEGAIDQDTVLADDRFAAVGEAWFQVEGTADDVPTRAIVMDSLRASSRR